MKKALTDEEAVARLKNWNTMAATLKTADLPEVEALLAYELANGRRPYIVRRLYVRKAKLETKEGLGELLEEIKKPARSTKRQQHRKPVRAKKR